MRGHERPAGVGAEDIVDDDGKDGGAGKNKSSGYGKSCRKKSRQYGNAVEAVNNVGNSDRSGCRLNIILEPVAVFDIHYLREFPGIR